MSARSLVVVRAWLVAGACTHSCLAEASSSKAILHKVSKPGETYGHLADHYYGARYLAHHLSAANRYQEPLKPGVTLIIPTYRRVVLSPGEDLEAFARRHLSRASRAAYLRELHQLTGPPKQGIALIVPPTLRHRVRPGETLTAIARTFYRDASARRRKLLQLYNELPSEKLRPWSVLRIPLDIPMFEHDRVQARSLLPFTPSPPSETAIAETSNMGATNSSSPESTSGDSLKTKKSRSTNASAIASASSKAPPIDWTERIETIERLYADGDYAPCLAQADQVLISAESAPRDAHVQLLNLAASSLVALGRSEEAESRFRTLLTLDPQYEPDAYRTSPKILDVFEAARRPR